MTSRRQERVTIKFKIISTNGVGASPAATFLALWVHSRLVRQVMHLVTEAARFLAGQAAAGNA